MYYLYNNILVEVTLSPKLVACHNKSYFLLLSHSTEVVHGYVSFMCDSKAQTLAISWFCHLPQVTHQCSLVTVTISAFQKERKMST